MATPNLHGVATATVVYAIAFVAVLIATAWWTARSRADASMAAALITPISIVGAYLVNQPIARAFAESRPYVTDPQALVLIGRTTDPSFPSDHAVVVGAATVAIWLVSRRLGYLMGATALLIGFSRVYVGVHYPIDVVAGLGAGAAAAYITVAAAADACRRTRASSA